MLTSLNAVNLAGAALLDKSIVEALAQEPKPQPQPYGEPPSYSERRALITGITGQDGSYLAEQLITRNYRVYGLVRRTSHLNFENLRGIINDPRLTLLAGDVTDPGSVSGAVCATMPHEIYNLAAQSYVGASWAQARATFETNALGFLNVLEAVRPFVERRWVATAANGRGTVVPCPDIRIYQASTSEMFGEMPKPGPGDWPQQVKDTGGMSENSPMRPRSPYGAAKLAAHALARVYRESYGMYVATGILFNHESPRRGLEFVTRKIARGVVRVKLGLQKKIILGDLSAARDWGYAPEYTDVMWRILQQNLPGDYVVGTGESHTVRDFLLACMDAAGLDQSWQYVESDGTLMRWADVPVLRADASKAEAVLNWKPVVGMKWLTEIMVKAEMEQAALQQPEPLRMELVDPKHLPPLGN
jgi:GDPmannose 4,6-dehydratase